jgi:SAM-dependent methyltransferase
MNWGLSRDAKSTKIAPGIRGLRSFTINRPTDWGHLDSIEADPSALIRVVGWALGKVSPSSVPHIFLDGRSVPFLQMFRTTRPDLNHLASPLLQTGLIIEYLVPESLCHCSLAELSLIISDAISLSFESNFSFVTPHYSHLYNSPDVLHREHIYGSGPPNPGVSQEVVPLAEALEGRILDFGCGSGALVRHLRSRGLDASGIELDRPIIRNSISEDVREFVTLYDGNFPTPYANGSFDSIFCSEVLEHIPNFDQAVRELSRLATKKVTFTVPDMSGIPLGFRHHMIPWHLLEGTHVNFFTQISLERLLRRYFSSVEFGRISPCVINDARFYVNLAAFCTV